MYTTIIERSFTFMPGIGHAMEANVSMEIHLATGNIATSGKSHIYSNSRIRALHAEGMAFHEAWQPAPTPR